MNGAQHTSRIFVVIPAYNEEETMVSVINAILSKNMFATVVLVDDGSNRQLRNFIQNLPIFYLRHKINLGQGAALQTGIEFAKKMKADIVVTFDADGQHSADDLPLLIEPILRDEADVIFGSRFLDKKVSQLSFRRKIILQCARLVNFIFTGLVLSDAHNGLRAFNKKAIENIVITENRMAHASEILFQVKKHRLRFKEVPVHVTYSRYSYSKGQTGLDSVKVFIDIVLHKLFR